MHITGVGAGLDLDQLTLFPFDDHALPFQKGVELELKQHRASCGKTEIVLQCGARGAHDSEHIAYYGTVIRVGDELRMWYLGQGPKQAPSEDQWFQRVCLATSSDGRNWARPNLGLVEHQGDRDNNLVDLGQGTFHVAACVVFHDPYDPNPDRLFKMAFEARKYRGRLAVAFSPDGLTWYESDSNPVGPWLEMAGGTKLDGAFHLSGQGGKHIPGRGRQFATHVSYDFEHWSEASVLGLQRTNVHPRPQFAKDAGEQIHLGAGLWNRGNVVIGFYGMWNGHPSNDRRMTTMNLGLAVSNDALHYREPVPNFPIVSAAEDGWELPPTGHQYLDFPALIQGQGFENIGDETLFWYAPWPEQQSDGVRVASWPRDRLGCFRAYLGRPGASTDESDPHVVSAPIDLDDRPAALTLNVDGISEYSNLRISVLDEAFQPIERYSADRHIPLQGSGFDVPVSWTGAKTIESGLIRIRIDFTGIRPEDTALYAIYLQADGT
tara:strand:- start:715 stop:2193 length:1479 start_codon:yes stop_codon:yes gene_type:complete